MSVNAQYQLKEVQDELSVPLTKDWRKDHHRVEEAHLRVLVEKVHHRVKDVKGHMTTSAKQQQQQQCSKIPYFKKRGADDL
ncbi:hypothetical protein ACLB2K_041439 [Fragaria x ananassa]